MTFKPVNTRISIEQFDDKDSNKFQLSSYQTIKGSKLIVVGDPVFRDKIDMAFEKVDWAETSDFKAIPDRRAPDAYWEYTTTVPELTSDLANGLFPFYGSVVNGNEYTFYEALEPGYDTLNNELKRRISEPVFNDKDTYNERYSKYGVSGKRLQGRRSVSIEGRDLLSLDAVAPETNYIYQDSSRQWNNVLPTKGYTLELSAMVPEGSSELVLDDGLHRVELILSPDGIYESSELRLALDWDDKFKKVRIASRGKDLYILDEDGFGFAGTSYLGDAFHASEQKELLLGQLGNNDGWILLDYVNQTHNGVYAQIEDDVDFEYTTSEQIAITPELYHKRKVDGYISAVYKSTGPFGGGTTKIKVQFNNSVVGAWTDSGGYTTINNPRTVVSLASVPVIKDSSDRLRFYISQQCSGTSQECPNVDEITVSTLFDKVKYDLVDEYGPPDGGNTVRIRAIADRSFLTTDIVYLGDTAIPTSDITHGTSQISFVAPSGDPGSYAVSVYDSATSEYFADSAYRYTNAYDKELDRYNLGKSWSKRSAFSIVDRVEETAVNIGHITGQTLDAKNYAATFDLSYLHPNNNVGPESEIVLQTAESSATEFTYTNEVLTEETLIAVGGALWDGLKIPSNLFYQALLGKGRYYIKPKITNPTDKEIRDAIKLTYSNGEDIDINTFPWDIIISNKDVNGSTLPSGVYSIVILTTHRYIRDRTVFVTFDAVDIANNFGFIAGYSEVLNVEPVFNKTDDSYYKDIEQDSVSTSIRIVIND